MHAAPHRCHQSGLIHVGLGLADPDVEDGLLPIREQLCSVLIGHVASAK